MDTHTCKPNSNKANTIVDLREYFSLWLTRLEGFYEERDRRYEDRFKAQETAVAAALAAAEKLTAAAFAASKEAIYKAEQAQTAYNASHNDLTRKMDSQNREMLPRPEADSRFKAQDERIEDIKTEIAKLREYKSEMGGRGEQRVESRQHSQWGIGIVIGSLLGAAAFLIAVIQLVIQVKGNP